MLFRKIVTDINDDGTERDFSSIVRMEGEPLDGGSYRIRYDPLPVENVTVDQLIEAVIEEMEGENYYTAENLLHNIIKHITAVASADVARQVLYNMIDQEGWTLGL